MKTNVKLSEFLDIKNLNEYKVHLACNNGECEPIDLFYKDYESWIGWNEYFGTKNDFNRPYILTLIEDYSQVDTYVFAGIFRVVNVIYGVKYVLEEVTDYEQYKGNLYITFKRYQGLRGRAFKLETLYDKLRITEIVEEQRQILKLKENSKPNIFDFATSELSQDAMFSWLIKWADDSYLQTDKELCSIGKSIVSLFSGIDVKEIHTIDVKRQWHNIDIGVEINENTFLTIEDKIDTSIHDDQLNRYKAIVEEKYSGSRTNLCFAYVKTGNEPDSVKREIEEFGFKNVSRQDILSVLNNYNGLNPILLDYRQHLQDIEDATNRYKSSPVSQWGWYEWQGFYKELEKNITVDNWGYVANPNGGFLGLWWNFIKNDEVRMYLQFEESKLCVKIEYFGDNSRSDIRWEYHCKLIKEAKKANIQIEKPARFGVGTYMTIGIVPTEKLFGDTMINFQDLIEKLKLLEHLIQICMQ